VDNLRVNSDSAIFHIIRNKCGVLVAYHHPFSGGAPINLSVITLDVEGIIKWGYRLLYLQLFIFAIMSMFYFSNPVTLAYLGAILSLFYIARIWKDYTAEEEGEIPESN